MERCFNRWRRNILCRCNQWRSLCRKSKPYVL
nr:MAG TPA: hypothetical protein [Bacteriophage sp.]